MFSNEWLDISGAPKDRTEILIYEKDKVEIASWHPEPSERLIEVGDGLFKKEKYDAGYWQVGYGFSARRGKPTLWMPLPAIPSEEKKDA